MTIYLTMILVLSTDTIIIRYVIDGVVMIFIMGLGVMVGGMKCTPPVSHVSMVVGLSMSAANLKI